MRKLCVEEITGTLAYVQGYLDELKAKGAKSVMSSLTSVYRWFRLHN